MNKEEIENKIKEILENFRQPDFGGKGAMEIIEFNQMDYAIGEILTLIQESNKEAVKYLINKIEVLIADEMLIAQKEGQPTSRLTSLAVKLKEIK